MNMRTVAFWVLLIVLVLTCKSVSAQQLTEKIRSEENPQAMAAATIEDLSWMQGSWHGDGLGMQAEETWLAPVQGVMAGIFRLYGDKGVSFYETILLGRIEGVFMMRLKHFTAELHSWEDPGETVDFRLLDVVGNTWYFSGLTIERTGADSMVIYVRLREGEVARVVPFSFNRVAYR